MDGLDFFSPSAGGEAYDPAAFERFKEQMKKNAQFVAAQQKSEQRQKKKEDALLKILMKFFQGNQKRGLVVLASRLLEQNIPASFILGVILLGNEDLQKEVRESAPLLESPTGPVDVSMEPIIPLQKSASEFSLMTAFSDPSIPLRVRAEIDAWGKNLYEIVSANPFKILETVTDPQGLPKRVVVDCMATVLQDYLFDNGLTDYSYETMASFSEFLIHGILKKAKEQVEGQKLVKE